MRRAWIVVLVVTLAMAAAVNAQTNLSAKWEELTAGDFQKAIAKAQGTCLLPFGIIEKHGPHLPLGTDLLDVRYVTEHAVLQEYAVIFPAYYFGQIFEAKHEPGTLAYSPEMQTEAVAGNDRRNGAQWLQKSGDCERAWRK